MENRPLVGVAAIIIKEDKVLLIKRKRSHGTGTWALIGGHLELNESIEDCTKREVLEEVGVKLKNITKVTYTNDIFPVEQKHYVTLYLTAEIESGEVTIMEPDAISEFGWFSWDNLPEPKFIPLENLVKQNFNPFKK